MRKLTILAAVGAALIFSAMALAASSPAVTTGAVTGLSETGATLKGTVNPEGSTTTYTFAWGVTDALGNESPAAPATLSSGTTADAVTTTLTTLQPGTTYYYQLQATNADGSADSPIRSFKTTGSAPPSPTTGGATSIGRYGATLTGTVTPNASPTTYYFQYGPTASYGMQTAPQALPAGTKAVSVTDALADLEPGVTFHYRVVATHSDNSITYGSDETFTTLAYPTLRPEFMSAFSLRSSTRLPFWVHVSGTVGMPASNTGSTACSGIVKVTVFDSGHVVARGSAVVSSACRYSASAKVTRLPGKRLGRNRARTVQLQVRANFRGSSSVAAAKARVTGRVLVK